MRGERWFSMKKKSKKNLPDKADELLGAMAISSTEYTGILPAATGNPEVFSELYSNLYGTNDTGEKK